MRFEKCINSECECASVKGCLCGKKHADSVSSFICIHRHGRKIKYTGIILEKQSKFPLISISVVWNSSGFKDEECEVFHMHAVFP